MWQVFKRWKAVPGSWQPASQLKFATKEGAERHMRSLEVQFHGREFEVRKV